MLSTHMELETEEICLSSDIILLFRLFKLKCRPG